MDIQLSFHHFIYLFTLFIEDLKSNPFSCCSDISNFYSYFPVVFGRSQLETSAAVVSMLLVVAAAVVDPPLWQMATEKR
jgi:hypothetical protein